MKFLKLILFIAIIFFTATNNIYGKGNDTPDSIKFAHSYIEALKNKMLGRNELAKKQFKECLQINPKSTASAYQLSKLLLAENNTEEAKLYAELCLKHKANNEWYLLLRAKIAEKNNNIDLYKSIYEKLVALSPNNLEYLYELATICSETQEYNKALSLLNEIQTQIGINETVSFMKNSIYYKQEQYKFIEIELKSLQKNFPDSSKYDDILADFYVRFNKIDHAIEMYKIALTKDSTNVQSKATLAWLYAKQKNYNKGFYYLKNVLGKTSIKFDKIFTLADLYLNAENDSLSGDKIEMIFQGLINRNDFNDKFLEKYIKYLYSKKDLSNAEKYALLSIEKFPNNYSSWNLYFDILLKVDRYDDLNKSAKKCLEYFPNQALIYFYCGYSYFLLKKYEKALPYLKTSIDYSVDNQELILQNYLIIAESYHHLGEHIKSDEYFEKYLQKEKRNPILMNNYAYYLLQRGVNYEKALKLSRTSLEIDPFNSSFLDTYAWILFAQKKYEMALNYIKRAYKYGGSKNASVLEHYGDIYHKLGNTENAKIMWKEAYRISKSKKILDKINK